MHICFLDIDGTLLLTGGAGKAAFERTLVEDFGISEIDGQVTFAGRSDRAIAMDLFASHGIDPTHDSWRRFCAGYLPRLGEMLHTHRGFVLPGVPELLRALHARGDVALGLLTGNLREGARRKLSHYGLWDWFPFGGFGDDHRERCDIAAAALAAARMHLNDHVAAGGENGRSNSQILVIGDTPYDIDCGRSIGARCIAVPTGNFPASALRESQPDVLVETLQDVAPILALLGE